MVTLSTRLQTADEDLNYGDIYYTVFPIPAAAVGPILDRDRNRFRVLVDVNGAGQISSGLMPDGKGDYFITVSKELRQRFDLTEGDAVSLTLHPDDSDYGMPLPAELAELWALDPEAHRTFHLLTPGKQRGLIYQVAKPKTARTRVKKAVQISEYLKSTGGRLDYRELNEYVKADNANW